MIHFLLIPVGKWALAHWGASAAAGTHAATVHTAATSGFGHAALAPAAPVLHGSASSHAVGVLTQHGASAVAKAAGGQLAKVVAAEAGGHAAASAIAPHVLHVLPVHVVGGAGLAKITAATAGSAAAVSVAPHLSLSAKKLATAFAKGFVTQELKRERAARVDLREIKRWFGQHESPDSAALKFTAIGKLRSGRFVPAPIPADGPYSLMQATYEPQTGKLIDGRVVRVTDSLSGSVRRSHRPCGLTVYASDPALAGA